MKKLVLLCTLLGSLFSSIASADDQTYRFGIANTLSPTSACITVKGKELNPRQSIYSIVFKPQKWVHGQVVRSRTTPCRPDTFLDGTAYDVRLDGVTDIGWDIGVTVIASQAAMTIGDNGVIFSSNGRPSIELGSCESTEGLHFFARQGPKLLWHEYYYLGYDIEPTCSDEELKE